MSPSRRFLAVLLLALTSCSEFKVMQPNSKAQAKERWSSVRAHLKLEMAQETYKAGQLDDAQKTLSECLSLDPESGEAYVLSAKILLEKGETAQASEALDEAMRHGADNAETDYLSGTISQRYQKLDDALAWYQRAVQREAMNAAYVEAVAETLVSLGRPNEALALVQSRLTDFEQNATLRSLAGAVYMMLGRYEDAANSYRDAARIAPGDERLKSQLGVALALSGNYAEAETTLAGKPAATGGPAAMAGASTGAGDATNRLQDACVLVALGRSELALHRGEEAKAALSRAVEADPTNARNWSLLARAAAESGDLLTARRAATQALELVAAAVRNIADGSGRQADANQLALLDAEPDYRLLLAYICWAQHDYPAAISSLGPLVENAAEGGHAAGGEIALYLLADSYRRMGRGSEAGSVAARALENNRNCAWARNWKDVSPAEGAARSPIDVRPSRQPAPTPARRGEGRPPPR